MSKKFNNNILLYTLVILVLIFAVVKLYRWKFTESTLNTKLVEIDTSKVTKLLLYPTSENRSEIKFYKEDKTWKVTKGKIVADPEPNTMQNLMNMLLEIKVQRLATREKSKWAEYNLTDTTATRIKVYESNKKVLDLYIGKFTYQRGNGMYGGMYGGGGSGTSYIRRADEDEVYAVDGFLTFSFNQQFNAFRNQTIARFDKSNVSKFTFKYPGDSSFTVNLADKKWMIVNQKLDSARVSDYLSAMAYKSSNSFNDNFVPSAGAQCQLTFEGKNMKTVNIDAYMLGNDEYVLNSNQNSKSWFASKYKGIFSDIFKNRKSFMPEKKKK